MDIIDNFLSKKDFKKIKDIFLSGDLPYYFNNCVTFKNDGYFYFTHDLYKDNIVTSNHFYLVEPLIKKLNILFLRRVKINCYTRDSKLIRHREHQDLLVPHQGAIFSLNTCNGGTYIKNKFIESKENRIILFDPSIKHSSTNCTDEQARFNININWR